MSCKCENSSKNLTFITNWAYLAIKLKYKVKTTIFKNIDTKRADRYHNLRTATNTFIKFYYNLKICNLEHNLLLIFKSRFYNFYVEKKITENIIYFPIKNETIIVTKMNIYYEF